MNTYVRFTCSEDTGVCRRHCDCDDNILYTVQVARVDMYTLNAIIFLIWAISTKIQEKSQHQRFLPNESIGSFSLIS